MALSSRTTSNIGGIHSYRIYVSQKYIDLTKQKLELTRLPRDPQWTHITNGQGMTKRQLEPLIDYWLEEYDWRKEETILNTNLPQYRGMVNGTRLHFVHRKSASKSAIPLLFVHGFPESFIAVNDIIDALCAPDPSSLYGEEDAPSFHVVAPSIPGFGFSDPIGEEFNNFVTTAALFDALMKSLGYGWYIAHGSGWGFKICRLLALNHGDSCIAIHTVNPDIPFPRSSFGYNDQDVSARVSTGVLQTTPLPHPAQQPNTAAYALSDSPSGLLAFMLDEIGHRPNNTGQSSPDREGPASAGHTVTGHSPLSVQSSSSSGTSPGWSTPGLGTRSPYIAQTPHRSPESSIHLDTWTPRLIINWTMMYWLPGPESALRWLSNSALIIAALWSKFSQVPIGITYFQDMSIQSSTPGHAPPQWAEAYHRVAMLRRREGRVRFPALERPTEVVMDIRELVNILNIVETSTSAS